MTAERLPSWATPHVAGVRARLGSGGMGESYASSVDAPCFAEESVKMARGADGAEVVSSAQVVVDFDPVVPLGSLVTVWGDERRVLAVERHQAPGWPAYQLLYLE